VTGVNARNRQLVAQLDLIEGLRLDLVEQASPDPLTQLHNRRYGVEWLVPLLGGVGHDDVKLVNDRHGNVDGDAVLVESSRRLRAMTPPETRVDRGVRASWTVSVGIAACPGSGSTAAELLEASDLAPAPPPRTDSAQASARILSIGPAASVMPSANGRRQRTRRTSTSRTV
jgi:GGDEF domain-containing protein